MTADAWDRVRRAVDVHVFLLAGQVPGTSHAATLAAARAYARLAEDVGFAGVWLAEHHFLPYGTCPSAVTFAAYVLGGTSRITVGTAAAILPNRHPVALGEEAALLDELSGGRFALGVARGGPWVDLEVFGTGLDRYSDGFPESLDLLRDWLSGRERIAAGGPRFRFRPVAVVPRPRRRVPVWVAATSPATVDLAAERGLPLLLGMHATDDERAALLRRYTDLAARHSPPPTAVANASAPPTAAANASAPPTDVAGSSAHPITAAHARAHPTTAAHANAPGSAVAHASAHLAHVEDDDDRAREVVRRALPRLLAGTREYVRIDGSPPRHRDLDAYTEHLLDIGAVGSPRTCRQRLGDAVATTGVRHVLLMVEAAGDPSLVTANLTRLAATLL